MRLLPDEIAYLEEALECGRCQTCHHAWVFHTTEFYIVPSSVHSKMCDLSDCSCHAYVPMIQIPENLIFHDVIDVGVDAES